MSYNKGPESPLMKYHIITVVNKNDLFNWNGFDFHYVFFIVATCIQQEEQNISMRGDKISTSKYMNKVKSYPLINAQSKYTDMMGPQHI